MTTRETTSIRGGAAHRPHAAQALLAMVLLGLGPVAYAQDCAGDFSCELSALRARTAIEGSTMGRVSAIEHGTISLSVSWELETPDLDWERYTEELRKRLAARPEFETTQRSDTSLVFVRMLPGDVHVLRVEVLASGPPMRARVTFTCASSKLRVLKTPNDP